MLREVLVRLGYTVKLVVRGEALKGARDRRPR
jgi:hypothetical protein